jgi:molybdenum cofactor guanylyltransferase
VLVAPPATLGIFVGGRSRRMGGRPKGRLTSPASGEPLVVALVREGRAAGLVPVLVGDASSYADLVPDAPRIEDDPSGVGPLGGLAALLAHAREGHVVTVACDMPHVTAPVLRRIADHPSDAAVVAPRRGPDAPFEPMLARYQVSTVAPVLAEALGEGVRSFQALLARLPVEAVPANGDLAAALEDWDHPEDVG